MRVKLWLLDMWVFRSKLTRDRTDNTQDCEAYKFHGSEQGWELAGSVESKGRPGLAGGREESALNMFKQMDLKGKAKDDTKLTTVHQNTISTIRVYSEGGGAVSKFSCKSIPLAFIAIPLTS
jgi:hypothetical protein